MSGQLREVVATRNSTVTEAPTRQSIFLMEFQADKVVHEPQYFDNPFEAPEKGKEWVEVRTHKAS